jgi:TusA-related sulfurtransferase
MSENAPTPQAVLDVGDTNCGQLVLLIFDKMKQMQPGDILEVVGYDPSAAADIGAWCRQTNNPLVFHRHAQSPHTPARFYIQKQAASNS